jgi:anaerobic selenocysteine-containing dehydrogenase
MSILKHEVSPDLYRKDFQWKEGDLTVTRTTQWSAPGCHNGCQVLFYTDSEGNLVKVEGDPNGPFNKGRLCMRCMALTEVVQHPDRLKYPMKRVGERGSGNWNRISWDEALDEITVKAKEIQSKYGPNTVGVCTCTARNGNGLANALGWAGFGTTHAGLAWFPGDSCYLPRMTAMGVIAGGPIVADCAQMYEEGYEHPDWQAPEYMLIWGNNPAVANADGFFGHWVIDLMKQGTRLIVVDPEVNWFSAHADYFLQLRPGTDGAVAMAMLNVIISENLYNEEFCEKWVYGLEELTNSVKKMTPERAGEIAGIEPDIIRGAARAFAKSNVASIQWGLAIDTHVHGCATALAIISLSVICGFVDVPGGNIFPTGGFDMGAWMGLGFGLAPDYVKDRSEANWDNLPGYKEYPFRRTDLTPSAHSVLEEMETGHKNKLRFLWITNNNPIACTASEAKRVFEAFHDIEYVVGADVFMTPTLLAFADIVLPISMSCERDSLREWWAPLRTISKVSTFYEAKSDEEIFLEIGRRMRPEVFPWKDVQSLLDTLLENRSSHTFCELEQKVYEYTPFEYRKYEKGLLRKDGELGFGTPTGRLEVYSLIYEHNDLSPLPYYAEPYKSPVRTPELMEEFPFVLTTGRRSWEFFHSEHRQIKTMREFHPDPLIRINDQDARVHGIADGDWVWIQNEYGKCKQKALVSPAMKQGVVSAEHGWWFPERNPKDGTFYGVFESNINNCTTQSDVGPSGYGCSYKTQLCKLYKVTPENDSIELTPEEEARSRATRKHPCKETVLY